MFRRFYNTPLAAMYFRRFKGVFVSKKVFFLQNFITIFENFASPDPAFPNCRKIAKMAKIVSFHLMSGNL